MKKFLFPVFFVTFFLPSVKNLQADLLDHPTPKVPGTERTPENVNKRSNNNDNGGNWKKNFFFRTTTRCN